jgi:excinuclease UvrABC nuclease subunit
MAAPGFVVYSFLEGDGTPIYVGQADHFGRRMGQHARSNPHLLRDAARIVAEPVSDKAAADVLESHLLWAHRPRWNRNYPQHCPCEPCRAAQRAARHRRRNPNGRPLVAVTA